jgi:hypothetical protein
LLSNAFSFEFAGLASNRKFEKSGTESESAESCEPRSYYIIVAYLDVLRSPRPEWHPHALTGA